jgi:hypothetical protein
MLTPTGIRRTAVLVAASALLALFSVAPHPPPARAAAGSPAVTPPLGWNSWNSFGCGVTETVVRPAADALVSSGMRDAGYQYVVVDDCWFDPQRDAAGNLRAHPTKFPSGMRALGDYIHARGLKFGIYQVPTERTCAQRVGTHPGATGVDLHGIEQGGGGAHRGEAELALGVDRGLQQHGHGSHLEMIGQPLGQLGRVGGAEELDGGADGEVGVGRGHGQQRMTRDRLHHLRPHL